MLLTDKSLLESYVNIRKI